MNDSRIRLSESLDLGSETLLYKTMVCKLHLMSVKKKIDGWKLKIENFHIANY